MALLCGRMNEGSSHHQQQVLSSMLHDACLHITKTNNAVKHIDSMKMLLYMKRDVSKTKLHELMQELYQRMASLQHSIESEIDQSTLRKERLMKAEKDKLTSHIHDVAAECSIAEELLKDGINDRVLEEGPEVAEKLATLLTESAEAKMADANYLELMFSNTRCDESFLEVRRCLYVRSGILDPLNMKVERFGEKLGGNIILQTQCDTEEILTIHALEIDACSNIWPGYSRDIHVKVSDGTGKSIEFHLKENLDGTLLLSFTPTAVGTVVVHIELYNCAILGSPFRLLAVEPSKADSDTRQPRGRVCVDRFALDSVHKHIRKNPAITKTNLMHGDIERRLVAGRGRGVVRKLLKSEQHNHLNDSPTKTAPSVEAVISQEEGMTSSDFLGGGIAQEKQKDSFHRNQHGNGRNEQFCAGSHDTIKKPPGALLSSLGFSSGDPSLKDSISHEKEFVQDSDIREEVKEVQMIEKGKEKGCSLSITSAKKPENPAVTNPGGQYIHVEAGGDSNVRHQINKTELNRSTVSSTSSLSGWDESSEKEEKVEEESAIQIHTQSWKSHSSVEKQQIQSNSTTMWASKWTTQKSEKAKQDLSVTQEIHRCVDDNQKLSTEIKSNRSSENSSNLHNERLPKKWPTFVPPRMQPASTQKNDLKNSQNKLPVSQDQFLSDDKRKESRELDITVSKEADLITKGNLNSENSSPFTSNKENVDGKGTIASQVKPTAGGFVPPKLQSSGASANSHDNHDNGRESNPSIFIVDWLGAHLEQNSNKPVPTKFLMKIGVRGKGDKEQLEFPIGVSTNPATRDVIICDSANNLAKVFCGSTGKHKFNLKPTSHFIRPSGVVANEDGDIFVKDNYCIQAFDKTGAHLRTFGKSLIRPFGLDMMPDGHLVVVDHGARPPLLCVFTQEGKLVKSSPIETGKGYPSKCRFMCTVFNYVIITDLGCNRVYVCDVDGHVRVTFGETGTRPGQMREPSGVAHDGHGRLIIADSKNHRIQIFDLDGSYITSVQLPVSIYRPSDMHLASNGQLLVSNFLEHCIKVYQFDLA